MPLCLAHTIASDLFLCTNEATFISDTRLPVCSLHRAAIESADRILLLLKSHYVPLTFTPIDEPEEFVSIICARIEFRMIVHALAAASHAANDGDTSELICALHDATATLNHLGKERWDALLAQLVKLAPAFPGVTVETYDPAASAATPTESPD